MLEEIGTRFRVTLRTERVGAPWMGETDRAILDALAGPEGCLTSEIARAIDLTPRATRTRLARLVERGRARRTRSGATSGRIEEMIEGIEGAR